MRKKPYIYYGGKLLIFILSVLLLSVIVFYISRLAPGDPLASYYGERVEKLSVQQREWAEARLGLNEPIYVQYIRWLQNALRGDLGISLKYKTDVLQVIGSRIPNTLLLGGISLVLIFILSLVLGILCTLHEGRLLDKAICKLGTVTSCIPQFWLSLLLIFVFSVTLRWLPSGGAYSIGGESDILDRISHLILPLTASVTGHLWYYAYIVRSRLLEETREDYALLARAKGLSRKSVLFRHCLRNITPTYLSLMAISVPHIMGGTYIIEAVFAYPGIGTLSYESARYKDYGLLMVLCIISGAAVILCNIIAQIISERIDPRMREPAEVTDSE